MAVEMEREILDAGLFSKGSFEKKPEL